MYKWFLVILLLITSGCSATRSINSFSQFNSKGLADYNGPKDFVDQNFVPEAARVLRDVPLIRAATPRPYVAGVNIWSRVASLFMLHGWGRKIVMPLDRMYRDDVDETLIHEYVHHLDDMDRDGVGEFINHEEFIEAFEALLQHPMYKDDAEDIMRQASHWITDVFGIGQWSEVIAYTADWLYSHKGKRDRGPDFMWNVFRNMLIRPSS